MNFSRDPIAAIISEHQKADGQTGHRQAPSVLNAPQPGIRPNTWQAHGGDLDGDRPVGLDGDAFDAMFGGMGAGSHASVPAEGVEGRRVISSPRRAMHPSQTYTSSNERMQNERMQTNSDGGGVECSYLHPDTLMPMPRVTKTQSDAGIDSGEGGWSVGFVVADGGVIRKLVPNTPAHNAMLVKESSTGVWQGKCSVGDRVRGFLC